MDKAFKAISEAFKATKVTIRNLRTVQPSVKPVMRRNLVHTTQNHKINEAFKATKVTIIHIRYDHDKLFEIGKRMKSDCQFSVLDPSAVKIIRRHRLNK